MAEQACTLLGFDYCAVMLADEARERVTVAGSCGLTPEYIALVSDEGSLIIHPPGSELDTPAARAFREGRTIAVPEVARPRGRTAGCSCWPRRWATAAWSRPRCARRTR